MEWDDQPLISCFYKGLREDVKDELVKVKRPKDLSAYIALAVEIDYRLYERRIERGQ